MMRYIPFLVTLFLRIPSVAAQDPADCVGAIPICDTNTYFSAPINGSGSVPDLVITNHGCLVGNEVAGHWYAFHISLSSPDSSFLAFSIQPPSGADLDFAVWGPYYDPPGSGPQGSFDWLGLEGSCPPAQSPVRCSFAGSIGGTGLTYDEALATSYGAGGYSYVRHLITRPGEVYLLYIDNWSSSSAQYTISWTEPPPEYSPMAILDCQLATAVADERGLPWMPVTYDRELQLLQWTSSSVGSWHLFDGSGRCVNEELRSAGNMNVSVGHLPAGIYLFHFTEGSGEQRAYRFFKD